MADTAVNLLVIGGKEPTADQVVAGLPVSSFCKEQETMQLKLAGVGTCKQTGGFFETSSHSILSITIRSPAFQHPQVLSPHVLNLLGISCSSTSLVTSKSIVQRAVLNHLVPSITHAFSHHHQQDQSKASLPPKVTVPCRSHHLHPCAQCPHRAPHFQAQPSDSILTRTP